MLMAHVEWGLQTKERGKLPVKFFEYSNSKEFLAEPDVFEYDKKMGKPAFDLILECNSWRD
jgi:hypothetical protein